MYYIVIYLELGICFFFLSRKCFCKIKFDAIRNLLFFLVNTEAYKQFFISLDYLGNHDYDFVPFRIGISSVKQKQSQKEGSSGVIGTADDIKSLKVRTVNCLWDGLGS